MSANDGFTVVKYKYPNRKKLTKRQDPINQFYVTQTETSYSDNQFELIINNIKQCKVELQGSLFYKEVLSTMSHILSENFANSEKFTCVEFQDFVCYGIGRISECPASRYQFALLLLLWEHFKPSGKCYAYDPVFGNLDREIVENFEMQLIPRNEEAKRKVSQKTLFFVPHGGKPLYNNILWANWGTCLENVIIFGNSFDSYQERLPSRQLELEASYIAQILPLTHEVRVQSHFKYDDIFNDMSLHYFISNELCDQPLSFWEDCMEPRYEDNNMEIILNAS